MKKLSVFSFVLALFVLASAPAAQAQTAFQVGPRVGLDFGGDIQFDSNTTFLIGADARIKPAGFPIAINPAFDFYFLDSPEGVDESLFQLNLNGVYEFAGAEEQVFTPYAGAGLALAFRSFEQEQEFFGETVENSSTDFGINLLGGAQFSVSPRISPFVELGYTALFVEEVTLEGESETTTANLIQVRAGLLFNL